MIAVDGAAVRIVVVVVLTSVALEAVIVVVVVVSSGKKLVFMILFAQNLEQVFTGDLPFRAFYFLIPWSQSRFLYCCSLSPIFDFYLFALHRIFLILSRVFESTFLACSLKMRQIWGGGSSQVVLGTAFSFF